ncbi:hypothetical protein X474_02925 [Dethiosulfatarculus sandiegensis]|uniref:Uncharacterized protein n=1 Tax=Dethiosulfatarculus sandiegensis TaxID=1429043 RepID=A0A0D2JC75_9BACT|nr:hypothetical protein X474_02925 [Dethiosulfatarculus sandiegensis]
MPELLPDAQITGQLKKLPLDRGSEAKKRASRKKGGALFYTVQLNSYWDMFHGMYDL